MAGPVDTPTGRRKPSRLVDAVRLPTPDHSDRRVRRFRRATRKYPDGKPEPFELRFGKHEDSRFTDQKETFSVNFQESVRTVRRIRRTPPQTTSSPLWISRVPGFPVLTRTSRVRREDGRDPDPDDRAHSGGHHRYSDRR